MESKPQNVVIEKDTELDGSSKERAYRMNRGTEMFGLEGGAQVRRRVGHSNKGNSKSKTRG